MKQVSIYILLVALAVVGCKEQVKEKVETPVLVKTDSVAPPAEPKHIKEFSAADQTSPKLLTLRALFEKRINSKRPPKAKYFFDITYYDSVGKFYYIEQNPVLKPDADTTDALQPALPYFYKYFPDTKKIIDAATNEEIKQ